MVYALLIGRTNRFRSAALSFGVAIIVGGVAQAVAAATELESWLGQPVSYEARGYAFKPWPALELRRVRIQSAQPIEITAAWLTPDYAEWVARWDTRHLRVMADEIVARPAALARLGLPGGPSSRIVTRMGFGRLKLRFGTGFLDLPAGHMEFGPDGTLARIRVTLEEHVSLDMTPRGGQLALLIQAQSLKWPVLPAFKFESVVAQGYIGDDRIVLDKIGASGDGGAVSGAMQLVANGKFTLDGNLKILGMRAKDLLERLYPRHPVDGALTANLRLNATGPSFETLGSALTVNGNYTLKAGSIDRFGLLEGLRKSGPGVAGGGRVRFDAITGGFSGGKGRQGSLSFHGLEAGALRASGSMTVTPQGELNGTVHGTLQPPGGETMSRSMSLGGRVDAPMLSVTEQGVAVVEPDEKL